MGLAFSPVIKLLDSWGLVLPKMTNIPHSGEHWDTFPHIFEKWPNDANVSPAKARAHFFMSSALRQHRCSDNSLQILFNNFFYIEFATFWPSRGLCFGDPWAWFGALRGRILAKDWTPTADGHSRRPWPTTQKIPCPLPRPSPTPPPRAPPKPLPGKFYL